jgi:hypothetical protein
MFPIPRAHVRDTGSLVVLAAALTLLPFVKKPCIPMWTETDETKMEEYYKYLGPDAF